MDHNVYYRDRRSGNNDKTEGNLHVFIKSIIGHLSNFSGKQWHNKPYFHNYQKRAYDNFITLVDFPSSFQWHNTCDEWC